MCQLKQVDIDGRENICMDLPQQIQAIPISGRQTTKQRCTNKTWSRASHFFMFGGSCALDTIHLL